jgi:hypothetical protein
MRDAAITLRGREGGRVTPPQPLIDHDTTPTGAAARRAASSRQVRALAAARMLSATGNGGIFRPRLGDLKGALMIIWGGTRICRCRLYLSLFQH